METRDEYKYIGDNFIFLRKILLNDVDDVIIFQFKEDLMIMMHGVVVLTASEKIKTLKMLRFD